MEFTKSLIKGKLVKRYKRFFTDIKVNKEILTAHCPNTGSMMGLLEENNDVWISKSDNPKRKLKYTLEIIKVKNNLRSYNNIIFNYSADINFSLQSRIKSIYLFSVLDKFELD